MSILASTKRLMSDHWPVPELPEPEPEPIFDDEHYELVDGLLLEKAMGIEEQTFDSDLHLLLGNFVRDHKLGRTVVEGKFALPKVGNNRIPDLAFVSYSTWPKSKRRPKGPYWSLAPDLAVEVIGPSDNGRDIVDKVLEPLVAGGQHRRVRLEPLGCGLPHQRRLLRRWLHRLPILALAEGRAGLQGRPGHPRYLGESPRRSRRSLVRMLPGTGSVYASRPRRRSR